MNIESKLLFVKNKHTCTKDISLFRRTGIFLWLLVHVDLHVSGYMDVLLFNTLFYHGKWTVKEICKKLSGSDIHELYMYGSLRDAGLTAFCKINTLELKLFGFRTKTKQDMRNYKIIITISRMT